jgi:hypothetical protein
MLRIQTASVTRCIGWMLGVVSTVCLVAGGPAPALAQSPVFKRFFVSGHSLTDDPLAEYIAAIGKSRGVEMSWNEQIVIGSPLRVRTRGETNRPGLWDGYRLGKNANGRTGLDILKEFSKQNSRPYDTLIVTEGHKPVPNLIWNDTVRYLRHVHERLIEHNPAARTFLYESWESVKDKSAPDPWIAVVRDESKVWSCVASRINTSLQHEGRTDRIATIPVGVALADLVEAIGKGAVAPLVQPARTSAFDGILSDDVHLTQFGYYYVALFTYVSVTNQPVEGVWRPPGISPATALALQTLAWTSHQKRSVAAPPDLTDCRQLMTTRFCDAWNAYGPNKWSAPQPGCKTYFARETMALEGEHGPNPFAFDPAADAAYWFAPP